MMPVVNPYNFISLPASGTKKKFQEYTNGTWTGKLICHLTAKTPLLLPDHDAKGQKYGKGKDGNTVPYDEYPFMSIGAKPMIPGSSLRGTIRSIFEAITDSCMFTNDNYYFSARTGVVKQPGLLKNIGSGWELYEARRYADKEKKLPPKTTTGECVNFDGFEKNGKLYVANVGRGSKFGYVLKMNQIKSRGKFSSYSIFELPAHSCSISLDEKLIDVFRENIRKYIEGSAGEKAKVYEVKMKNLPVGGYLPVWYEKDGNNYYLALSQLSRNVYTRKPKDILPDSLKHCAEKKSLCPACALFGFVNEKSRKNNDGSVGSRVRFTDAWCEAENIIQPSVLLPILASPRSSSQEFYLRHQDARKDFYHADTPGVMLAGRKFYWHHNNFNPGDLKPDYNQDMSSYMQYAKAGAKFNFEVYFDSITLEQLNQLYTALSLGENNASGDLCHKIGHGKPLGFGSVKIVVEKAVVRTFSFESGQQYALDEDWLKNIKPVNIPLEVKKAMHMKTVAGKTIDYPRCDGKIFKWFSRNRPPADVRKAKFYSKLPLVTSEVLTLPDDPKY